MKAFEIAQAPSVENNLRRVSFWTTDVLMARREKILEYWRMSLDLEPKTYPAPTINPFEILGKHFRRCIKDAESSP